MAALLLPGLALANKLTEETPFGIGSQPETAMSTPPAVELTGQKIDMAACRDRMARFATQLGDLILSMDKLPPYLTELGWEAASRLPAMHDEQLAAGCEVLRSSAARGVDLMALQAQFADRSRARGCIGVETYLGILGVRTILDGYNTGVQAICDSTACPLFAPPVIEPKICTFVCAGVAAIDIASEIISTRMDVADKCADLEHEELMAQLRQQARARVPRIYFRSSEVDRIVDEIAEKQAGDDELSATDDAIEQGFDGPGGRNTEAIGPALTGLATAIDDSRAVQVTFEQQAIRNRLESALVTGATYSRMIRPRMHDGLLEEVRELVAERIQAVAAAGGPTDAALGEFRLGDAAFNQSDYIEALAAYRRAYLKLIAGVEPKGGSR